MTHLIRLTLLALVACGTPEAPTPPPEVAEAEAPTDNPASRAATIAKAVREAPGEAEAILAKHGLTTTEFEALLYEVAADADLSKAYLKALE
ncbi:MAG: hypothetical protein KC912_25870 [Proteobacteria bacterium]|nr:hypothetical protein [Pseudomonadota bacterium]